MNREVAAALMPLFDRLGQEPDESLDGILLDSSGLMASLQRDLGRLLNTRNGLTIADFLSSEPDVLQDGLPDVSGLWPSSKLDRDRLAEVVTHALAAFEPRLTKLLVEVTAVPEAPAVARVHLAAAVQVGRQLRRVDFRLAMDARGAVAEEGV